MQRRSSAQIQQVIVMHSHGHLFLPLDIIMGIPIQAKTIQLQHIQSDASESDATLRIDDLTNSTVQSRAEQPPTNTHCLSIGIHQHEKTRRQGSEKAYPY